MKTVVINEPGGPEKLIYQDVPTPTTKPGWSLVKVKGFGDLHTEGPLTRREVSPDFGNRVCRCHRRHHRSAAVASGTEGCLDHG